MVGLRLTEQDAHQITKRPTWCGRDQREERLAGTCSRAQGDKSESDPFRQRFGGRG